MKEFNTVGKCIPEIHYMVDLTDRLIKIKKMVDKRKYFVINRARQFGKTTILSELEKFLNESYIVLFLDFQRISSESFENESFFVMAFSQLL